MQNSSLGIYVHWPFCASKCPYCDFNSHVRDNIDEDLWASAYEKALDDYVDLQPDRAVGSIFFGGGTPSLMSPNTVERIVARIQKNWHVANDVEITLEANPTSIEASKFQGFQLAGVNRVSIGVQALNDKALKFLGRQHSAKEAKGAIEIAARYFDRFSFDLIYARPDQSLGEWEAELSDALKLQAGHLSLYQLTIERNTPFYNEYKKGNFFIPDQDLAADFYNLTQDVLEVKGLRAYEVSNHAQGGHESRHNMNYWLYGDYIGVGPGAHGRISKGHAKYETREHAAPEIWLEQTLQGDGPAFTYFNEIDARGQAYETLIMGLRLREGITMPTGWIGSLINADRLHTAYQQGWLIASDKPNHLQASLEGWLRLNALIDFITVDQPVAA